MNRVEEAEAYFDEEENPTHQGRGVVGNSHLSRGESMGRMLAVSGPIHHTQCIHTHMHAHMHAHTRTHTLIISLIVCWI